jgi:hypothetical protein
METTIEKPSAAANAKRKADSPAMSGSEVKWTRKPIIRGRSFVTKDEETPAEFLINKIMTVSDNGWLKVLVTPLGLPYLVEKFDGGKFGLTPLHRAGLWDYIRTLGRLKIGMSYVGDANPPNEKS